MMNIREYFEMRIETVGYEMATDEEMAMYEMYEDDFETFEKVCIEKGIDLSATGTDEETVLTLWVWDMCEE